MPDEMQEYRERQREAELSLLRNHAVSICSTGLLYSSVCKLGLEPFDNSAYESAIFYGFAGFSVQAAFYFVYRAVFEDSSDHRRQLKRMRNKNRQHMAQLKFEQEKAQLESVLNQQMGIYQRNLAALWLTMSLHHRSQKCWRETWTPSTTHGSNSSSTSSGGYATSATTTSTPTSNAGITGNRPPSNHGDSSRTEIDAGRVLAEIIARLDSIESQRQQGHKTK